MKKKLAIIIIVLLASGGVTWAILNQSQQSQQQKQTEQSTNTSTKKSSIPGGQTIIGSDNSQDSSSNTNSSNHENSDNNQIAQSSPNSQDTRRHSSSPTDQPNTNHNNSQQPSPPTIPPQQPPVNPPTPPITPPPQPPVAPPTPPQPPTPHVNPPNQPLTDEQKAQKILNDLKSSTNQNVAQFTNDDNQIRTVLWTKGINAPRLGTGGDFRRVEETHGGNQFVTYATIYRNEFLNSGWYDVDKAHGTSNVDRNLCFGAVAANQLHWWMNYNKNRVQQFLVKTNYAGSLPSTQAGTLRDLRIYPDSFLNQQDSKFFTMIKNYFGNNSVGYYADPLIDMFINGHKPKPGGGSNDPDWEHGFQMDSRGGFFHDVFGKRNLTRRLVPSDFNDFTNEMKKAFRDGESVGIVHHTSAQNTHIITAWGLEYDLDGRLVGMYVTDSDDQDDPRTSGMKRYGINNVDNHAVFSNNITNPRAGSKINQISTLGLGEDKWNEYLQ